MNLSNLHLLNKAPWAVIFFPRKFWWTPRGVSLFKAIFKWGFPFAYLHHSFTAPSYVLKNTQPSEDTVTPLHFSTARACSALHHWSWGENLEKTSCTNKISPRFQIWWLCTSALTNGEKEIIGFGQKSLLMQPQNAFLLQCFNCCWHPLTLAFFHVHESILYSQKESIRNKKWRLSIFPGSLY